MRINLVLGLIVVLGLTACETHENPLAYQSDAHGRGSIDVYLEDSYKPLFTTSIYTFQSLFPKATITPKYLPEGDIITAFSTTR